jgi:hypothetical protein
MKTVSASTVSNTISNTLASNGRITSGPGGSKILVFPKQNTEFFSSPEGGLSSTELPVFFNGALVSIFFSCDSLAACFDAGASAL